MPPSPSPERSHELLSAPLDRIRGVGPRVLDKFATLGLKTVGDALYHLPLRYEDRRQVRKIAQLRDGRQEIFSGEIISSAETLTSKSRRRIYEVVVSDTSGYISLKWFHYRKAWFEKQYAVGRRAVFIGDVKRFGALREVHHPDVEFLTHDQDPLTLSTVDPLNYGRIVPIYPLTEGLHQKTARKIWYELVNRFSAFAVSVQPPEIIRRRRLMPLAEALACAHNPVPAQNEKLETYLAEAHRSLVYDEFFYLELGLALRRRGVVLEKGIPFAVNHVFTKPLAALLPFRLTDAQRRVLGEIKRDMMQPHPMNRLVQGDVGSGKTIVALMAALIAIENETQVAVVAPTEILAEQHYLNYRGWFKELGLEIAFLSGSTSRKNRSELLSRLAAGEIDLLVGTHAVLQEDVIFKRLGLGVVDEQHRFGVKQRNQLRKKGATAQCPQLNPDILVMTATPIPRTLALTLYGDLALSVIDEMPPGRTPVKTRVLFDSARDQAHQIISRALQAGRQAYVVYPLVEESENSDLLAATDGAATLQQIFPDYRTGLLHGRMKADEKEEIMREFKARTIDIMVSTTVIEVGIDVPNATVMVVEHAERFGLAQLHQLRGRIGRGEGGGTCVLIRSAQCSAEGQQRLAVMVATTDGFKIAEEDLAIRGPGEFLGTRQSGIPDFRVANLLTDGRVLEEARQDAFALAEDPEFFSSDRFRDLRVVLMQRWGTRLELASVG
ncbi:MAG: ATP-dependent DNA helicase RecG [Desulfuromonadales bacterium]|nr:ATP-dependent DNA helicase RecG [Desulfuromonadales bacterium]MDT8423073.1 ATP-dependent DNA helicase RecG [Desulfuromonadales bacterium]